MRVVCNKAEACVYRKTQAFVCPHGKEHNKNTSCRLSCVRHVRRGEKEGAESKCIPIA